MSRLERLQVLTELVETIKSYQGWVEGHKVTLKKRKKVHLLDFKIPWKFGEGKTS